VPVGAELPSTVVVGGREKVVVVSTEAVETGSSVMVAMGVPEVTGLVMKGVTVALGADVRVRRTVAAEEVELMKVGSTIEEGTPLEVELRKMGAPVEEGRSVEITLELEVRVEMEKMGSAVEDGPAVVVMSSSSQGSVLVGTAEEVEFTKTGARVEVELTKIGATVEFQKVGAAVIEGAAVAVMSSSSQGSVLVGTAEVVELTKIGASVEVELT
jgi:hypothetical protein